jgi:hypothetical protein
MSENDFNNYDLRRWLDRGLSRHPEPLSGRAQSRKADGRILLTRLILPVAIAGSMLAVGGPATSQTNGRIAAPLVQSDSSRYVGASAKVSWTVAVPHDFTAASPASEFSANAAKLLKRIRDNNFADVPAETRRLAAAIPVYQPTTGAKPESWINEVADALAKFTD